MQKRPIESEVQWINKCKQDSNINNKKKKMDLERRNNRKFKDIQKMRETKIVIFVSLYIKTNREL